MEKIVLTTEELNSLKSFQTTRAQLVNDFGYLELQSQELESQKKKLVDVLNNLKAEETKVSKELQEKYGDGNIDLNSGEFVPVG